MNFIHDILNLTASQINAKFALIDKNSTYTYEQMRKRTDQLAVFLKKYNIRKGDKVAILLPNQNEVALLIFALSKLHAVFIILDNHIKLTQLKYIIDDSDAKLLITDKEKKELIQKIHLNTAYIENIIEDSLSCKSNFQVESSNSSDNVCFIYTSGSTGKPKAIMSSHKNILFAATSICKCLKINEPDIIGNFLPLSFDYGLYQIFISILSKSTLYIASERAAGPTLLKLIENNKITILPVVPSIAESLILLLKRSTNKLNCLRLITNTGAVLREKEILSLKKVLPSLEIFLMYGLTECKRVSILHSSDLEAKINSVGKPIPGTKCMILDENLQSLPANSKGQLLVLGPHVMQGYWNSQELTAQKFIIYDNQRALLTGDICSIDEEGFLYFHGRNDDIYKNMGFRVTTLEIEAAVSEIPEIKQNAVSLSENRDHPFLFVSSEILDTEQIFRILRDRLEEYKMPDKIIILDQLPLNNNGKIDRNKLRSIRNEYI